MDADDDAGDGHERDADRMELAARPGDLWPVAAGVVIVGMAAFVLGLFFPA
jgi:hypothetical protein